jgi:putative phosphoesterase
MKVGLLSDTHGRDDLVQPAAEQFESREVDALIHSGDVTRVRHIEAILELGIPVHLVYGNCDFNQDSFRQAEAHTPLNAHGKSVLLKFEETLIGVTHGHHERLFDDLRAEEPDYIVHGHTHERRDEVQGGIRYVNPGAVKPANPSIAFLDLSDDTLEFFDVQNEKIGR